MKKYLLLLTAFVITTLSACSPGAPAENQAQTSQEAQKPTVAATIFPIYDITRQVAGDQLEVELILPPGASPHAFSLTPSDAQKVADSQIIFAIGHGLDTWTKDISKITSPPPEVVTLDKKITLISSEDDHGNEDEHEDEATTETETMSVNPHYWLSLTNAELMVDQMVAELSRSFPEKASTFEANGQNYKQELQSLAAEVATDLESLQPIEVATFHNAWVYLERDHQVDVIATFEEFPGEEPSFAYIQNFSQKVGEHQVSVIFSEPQFSTQALEPIAQDLGVEIMQLDPIGGVPERDTYIQLMRYNFDQIISSQAVNQPE